MTRVRWEECRSKPGYFEMFLQDIERANKLTHEPRDPAACIHRGESTGTQECPTCSGTVKLKVFTCAIHGECTIQKRIEGVACCPCDDYENTTQ